MDLTLLRTRTRPGADALTTTWDTGVSDVRPGPAQSKRPRHTRLHGGQHPLVPTRTAEKPRHHRSTLGTPRRRSHPHPARRHQQRRLRRLLALPPGPRTPAALPRHTTRPVTQSSLTPHSKRAAPKSVSKIRCRGGARRGDLSPCVALGVLGSRPPRPACQLGPSCGRCEQAERAGLLDGHAAGDARRASGAGDACAPESPKHVTPARPSRARGCPGIRQANRHGERNADGDTGGQPAEGDPIAYGTWQFGGDRGPADEQAAGGGRAAALSPVPPRRRGLLRRRRAPHRRAGLRRWPAGSRRHHHRSHHVRPRRPAVAQPGVPGPGSAQSPVVAALERFAADSGTTIAQLAVAWVLAHPAVQAAIVGSPHIICRKAPEPSIWRRAGTTWPKSTTSWPPRCRSAALSRRYNMTTIQPLKAARRPGEQPCPHRPRCPVPWRIDQRRPDHGQPSGTGMEPAVQRRGDLRRRRALLPGGRAVPPPLARAPTVARGRLSIRTTIRQETTMTASATAPTREKAERAEKTANMYAVCSTCGSPSSLARSGGAQAPADHRTVCASSQRSSQPGWVLLVGAGRPTALPVGRRASSGSGRRFVLPRLRRRHAHRLRRAAGRRRRS